MPAHSPNNVCRFWQTLLAGVAKAMPGSAFRRLATKAGEKCGLLASGWQPGVKSRLLHRAIKSHRSSYE